MRYIAVFHEYWMSGGRFIVMDLDVKTREGADQVAAAMAYEKGNEFNHCAYRIVEISDRERLVKRGLFGRTYFKESPAAIEQIEKTDE